MSIQWADDFSRYGIGAGSPAAMLAGLPYANLGNISGGAVTASPDPNDTGRAFQIGANGNNWPLDFRIALPTVVSGTLGAAFRAWLSSLPGNNDARPALCGFQRTDGTYIVYARVEQNGAITIQARVGGVQTQIFDSINPIVQPSSFNHYELVHNRSTGAGQLYVNGVLRISYSGVDTADNLVFVNFSNRSASNLGIGIWIKDLYIWDSTGTQNNTVAGTVIVRRLKPNGDVAIGGWTITGGATATAVLAKDAPNDATFIAGASTPLPAPVRYNLEDLPPDVTSVRGLISVVRQRKVDGGDANVQTSLTPNNGTNYANGANRPITSAYSYYFDVSEINPATATPYSPADVNATQQRLNRTV